MGVNHYLGTFDSEWDAAAIYGKWPNEGTWESLSDTAYTFSFGL